MLATLSVASRTICRFIISFIELVLLILPIVHSCNERIHWLLSITAPPRFKSIRLKSHLTCGFFVRLMMMMSSRRITLAHHLHRPPNDKWLETRFFSYFISSAVKFFLSFLKLLNLGFMLQSKNNNHINVNAWNRHRQPIHIIMFRRMQVISRF